MDPLQTQPAPASPVGIQGTNQPTELSQEQMRMNLQDMMDKIDSRYQDFNSQKFASDNKLREQKSESFRQIFDLFQSMGVDPSDVEQVKTFLDKIRTTNPELSQEIEKALESLIGDETDISQTPEVPTSDNMNININETPS